MKTKEVCDWVFACGQAAGRIEAGKEFRQAHSCEKRDRELERAAWKKKVEAREAELAKVKEKLEQSRAGPLGLAGKFEVLGDRIVFQAADGLTHALFSAPGVEARLSDIPCQCATGPWVQGIPEVMDGRRVLVEIDGERPAYWFASGGGFERVTRYAEIRKGPE